MTSEADVDRAIDEGDFTRAALLAASLPSPIAYRQAMQRSYEASKLHPPKRSIPMFQLLKHPCSLTNFNPRIEMHGEDPKPAADLSFTANLPNDKLALFDASLRDFLFWKNGDATPDTANDSAAAPHLRFPKLGILKWNTELVGAKVTIHVGEISKHEVALPAATVCKFKIDPQEGGTCLVYFLVQCHPDEKQSGKLAFMIGRDFDVTVEPPGDDDPEPQAQIPGGEVG